MQRSACLPSSHITGDTADGRSAFSPNGPAHRPVLPTDRDSGAVAGAADESVAPQANMTACFAETAGAGVCRGAYAPALLAEWHAWDAAHGSENEPVDCFGAYQLYVMFVVADGGSDLEHFDMRTFEEARSVLLQVRSFMRANAD